MKTLTGLLAVALAFSVSSFAQGGRDDKHGDQGQGGQQQQAQPQHRTDTRPVGNGYVPSRGPAAVRTPYRPPQDSTPRRDGGPAAGGKMPPKRDGGPTPRETPPPGAPLTITRAIPKPHTCTRIIRGWGMTPAAGTLITISIILGNTDVSPAALAHGTSGGCAVVIASGSSWAFSSSRSRPTTTTIAAIGSGIATIS